MIDHEMSDPAGGALTITHDHQGVWITVTEDRDEVTVGPFPARTLRASFDMGDDLMDGGVTAAAFEAEVVSPERARSLVQENDELRARIGRVEEARDLYRRDTLTEERLHGEARRFALAWKETARELFGARNGSRAALRYWQEKHDHPLTADDITDEMVVRGNDAWSALRTPENTFPRLIVETILRAALTPPPSRPEGAVDLKHPVITALAGMDSTRVHGLTQEDIEGLCDRLAERGVRVTGAES